MRKIEGGGERSDGEGEKYKKINKMYRVGDREKEEEQRERPQEDTKTDLLEDKKTSSETDDRESSRYRTHTQSPPYLPPRWAASPFIHTRRQTHTHTHTSNIAEGHQQS